jgi:hypothetical protein
MSQHWVAVVLRESTAMLVLAALACGGCGQRTRDFSDTRARATAAAASPPPPQTLNFARHGHSAAALDANRVLVCGGEVADANDDSQLLDSCEVFDKESGTWSAEWPSLASPRRSFTMTALRSELDPQLDVAPVLIAGGMADGPVAIDNAQVGSKDGWSAGEPLVKRWSPTASLLPDGSVVLLGGNAPDEMGGYPLVSTMQVRAPSSEAGAQWRTIDSPFSGWGHTATVLAPPNPGGAMEVMVVGGCDQNANPTTKVRVYSLPVGSLGDGGWRPLEDLPLPRCRHTATLLENGDVLVVGGIQENAIDGVASQAYRYDWHYQTWKEAGITQPRSEHMAARLGTRVIVAGGAALPIINDSVEVYDPERDPVLHPDTVPATSNPWTLLKPLNMPRTDATMTPLGDDSLLVVGGFYTRTSQTSEIIAPTKQGEHCAPSDDCVTGHCVDGVCCDTACAGSCEACNEEGHAGTCIEVDGSPRQNHPACGLGAACVAGRCSSDCRAGFSCGSDEFCGEDGGCETRKGPGESCALASECSAGLFCADGVCCNEACNGACESCSEPNGVGVCVAVEGEPRPAHPGCLAGASCVHGECTVDCGAGGRCGEGDYCSNDERCLPKNGLAEICESDDVCAGALVCVAHTCQLGEAAGASCLGGKSCRKGLFCVDDVCCSEPSCDEDSSCSLANTAGICKKKLGAQCASDLECGSAHCATVCCELGSCPGDCRSALDCDGTMTCERGKCVARSARCSDDGLSSSSVDGTTVACGAFKCSPRTGQCRTSCQMSEHCAPPNLCDPSGACRPVPPARSLGSCALSVHGRRSTGNLAWLLVASIALGRTLRARRRAA